MYIRLLRKGSFVYLWLAQIASTLAVQLYKIGVMVVIFDQTGSTLQAGGVLVANSLPHILLGPVAGALVDRYPRKLVLIVVELARALLVGLSLFLAGDAALNVWAIYIVVAGLAIADAFYKPALLAMIPTLVEKNAIVHANSLVNSTNYGVLGIGYGVGGLLILYTGLATIVGIDLALFLLAALLVARIRLADVPALTHVRSAPDPILRSIRDGMAYLRRHDLARSLITMEFLEHWPHGVWTAALMLAFTTQSLQASEEFWGYQNAIYFGGNLAGAALAVAFASRLAKRPGWVIIVNALLMALLTLAYALSTNIWFAMFILLISGPPMAVRDVAQDSLLQSTVEGGVLGRVYATRQMLSMFAFMISGLLLAALADLVDVRMVYLLGAALYFVTAFYALAQPSMRRAGLSAREEMPVAEPVGD
ncbi:MAG: MFS transporter [Caldilineaceae bacterium]|nr:MFS transporter [Caldilineaceae bacterium]